MSPSITIQSSRGGPVYAGTELVVTFHTSFNSSSAVTVPIAVDIRWSTVNGNISNSSRTTVSPVSDDGGSYIASLTFQPITTSDAGQYTVAVTFSPPADSMHIAGGSANAKHTIAVDGMLRVRMFLGTCSTVGCTLHCMGHCADISTYNLMAVHTCTDLLCLFLPPALPALVPVVQHSSSSSTAGENMELNCSVPVVEHLVQYPNLDWSGGSVGQPGVIVTDLAILDGNIWRNISFSPLKSSHGGKYACQAGLSIPTIGLEETWTSSRDLSVQSESLSCAIW